MSGDLLAAFDFSRSSTSVPALPSTAGYQPPDKDRHADYVPTPPLDQSVPRQEPGTRPARALGYRLEIDDRANPGSFTVQIRNSGSRGAAFQVRSTTDLTGPWTYTVGAGQDLKFVLHPLVPVYSYEAHGPNGLFRSWRGSNLSANPVVTTRVSGQRLTVRVHNPGPDTTITSVTGVRHPVSRTHAVRHGHDWTFEVDARAESGWFDVSLSSTADPSFARRLRGHLENSRPSVSDPALG